MANKSGKPARKSSDQKPIDRSKRKLNKEVLFENFFQSAHHVLPLFELYFGTQGTWATAMGIAGTEVAKSEFQDATEEGTAKARIRRSFAWSSLSELYDYASDGIISGDAPEDIVIRGAEVLSLVTTENRHLSEAWDHIVAMADGRFGLDAGENLTVDKLALLAAVDVRTIRNAISAGDLVSLKAEGTSLVQNSSARQWLGQRKGFKPTRALQSNSIELKDIASPIELGNFLLAQRTRLGTNLDSQKILVFHPLVNTKTLIELERGVFQLPLDTMFPLADFYQVDRDAFLSCVMRCFFKEQLVSLTSSLRTE